MPSRPQRHKPPRLPLPDGRPSASQRGYDANWRKLRLIVLRARPVCQMCQRESAAHVDHIVSLERGGTNEESNLQTLCHSCHSKKTVQCDGGFGRRKETR